MNKYCKVWITPVIGLLSAATAASAQDNEPCDQSGFLSTNRLTLSFRMGLNISGKFKNVGRSFSTGAPLAANRRTPDGDRYNYDNGYVLVDSSGNFGGQSWNWGYDNASQVNSKANTISFNRTVATGLPSENSGDGSSYFGPELAYDYTLGETDWWHHLRVGIESAVNFMPVGFNSGSHVDASLAQQTDTYTYTPGTTPPSAPYQGSRNGPGFVINVPASSSAVSIIPGATFIAHQHFDAKLWGARLGPCVELPVSQKLDLLLTGGLAAGLIDGSASWNETLVLPGGVGSLAAQGTGHDTSVLWGFYAGLDAAYQFASHWSVEVGGQYQNLGTYEHNFGGRELELDLSKSIFFHAGLSYSF
ncbi:MAG TPA: hypothetical protein VKV04_13495 [Verrucomicrobiae bacterium]|nr:hypothetical protein [Verrucomicrobiae bacterium]